MEGVRLIQCYSCFSWCKHLRSECPTKNDPQICSNCSETGHIYTECFNDPYCLNCQNSHPATARICPTYLKALEEQKPLIAQQLAHLILHNSLPTNNLESDIFKAIKSATLNSNTPLEFSSLLLDACKTLFSETSDDELNVNPNESSNPPVEPPEILTKNESSLNNADLENELKLAQSTIHIPLPKFTEPDLMPTPKQ